MKTIQYSFIILAFSVFLAASACKKTEIEKGTSATTTDDPAPKVGDNQNADDRSLQFIQSVMTPYEKCRGLLAADKIGGISECANKLAKAAQEGQAEAPDATKELLAQLASAAEALADLSENNIEEFRVSFGEVSKVVVALLTAVPSAAKNYYVFECPMAKGYKRWAQTDKKLANPYMGSKMLECGSEVHDHHQGMMKGDHMKHGSGTN